MLRLQMKTSSKTFQPTPAWQSSHPTAFELSVISAGHVCCQLRRLVTTESNRDGHLEPGRQGSTGQDYTANGLEQHTSQGRVHLSSVVVFEGRVGVKWWREHYQRCHPLTDTQSQGHKENARGPACGELSRVRSSQHHLSWVKQIGTQDVLMGG